MNLLERVTKSAFTVRYVSAEDVFLVILVVSVVEDRKEEECDSGSNIRIVLRERCLAKNDWAERGREQQQQQQEGWAGGLK